MQIKQTMISTDDTAPMKAKACHHGKTRKFSAFSMIFMDNLLTMISGLIRPRLPIPRETGRNGGMRLLSCLCFCSGLIHCQDDIEASVALKRLVALGDIGLFYIGLGLHLED
jgi:hypothetical protein